MTDPVSWLQIEPGWNIVTATGAVVGTVTEVEGDKESDIFDGLGVSPAGAGHVRYVPAEIVGAIVPGVVTLTIADAAVLARFEPSAPETVMHPERPSLTARLPRWLGGKR